MKFSSVVPQTLPLGKFTRRCHEYQHLQAEKTFLKYFPLLQFFVLFFSDLTTEEMIQLTYSDGCVGSGNPNSYLEWNTMKWNFKGVIQKYNLTSEELCKTSDSESTELFFPSIYLLSQLSLTLPFQWVSLT